MWPEEQGRACCEDTMQACFPREMPLEMVRSENRANYAADDL